MAPGFDQICMSRPRIIYLDLALPASLPYFGATRRATPGMDTRRGCSQDHRRKPACTAKTQGKRRAQMEDAQREGGEGGGGGEEEERMGGMCQRDTRGTLTLPDYPMNRNVIYGSFSEPEGSA